MITVKLAQVPGATQEYVLESGATISTLLETAGKDAANYTVTRNNATAGTGDTLNNGDIVILAKQAVGNAA